MYHIILFQNTFSFESFLTMFNVDVSKKYLCFSINYLKSIYLAKIPEGNLFLYIIYNTENMRKIHKFHSNS